MKKLWETSPELVVSGICPGLMPQQIPLWRDGRSVRFENASARSAPARSELVLGGTLTGSPLDVAQSFTLARKRLYIATTTGVFRYIGPQTEYEVASLLATQPASGSFTQILTQDQTDCLLVPWGDHIISTDGVNNVKLDENTGSMSSLVPAVTGGNIDYARVAWKYMSHFFLADTNLSGRRVYWSDLDNMDDAADWTPSLSSNAGSNPIRDFDSRIRAGVLLGPNCAIYSQDQMVQCRHVGGADVFAFSPALTGIGALNPRSVISHNRLNWGLHRRGIFWTDGISFDYVDEPVIRSWLKANVNWGLSNRIRGYHDEGAQMVCWTVSLLDGTWVTIGYGYKTRAFSIFNEGMRFGEEADVFDDCILGNESTVYIQGSGDTVASYIETKPLDCGSREIEKTFQMIQFDLDVTGTVTIQLAFLDDSSETASYEQTYTNAGLDEGKLYIDNGNRVANNMQLKISAAAGSSFRLGGFQIHGEAGGFSR